MYDEEEDFDDEDSVILAGFEWSPNSEKLDWNDPDFSKNITARLKGITEESFEKEVEAWQKHINLLPDYDEYEIRKEIRNWILDIPTKDDFNIESFAKSYALQVQYRNRITELVSLVFAHYEMINQAHRSLKEMAVKLASGPKHDKDAIASFTVHQFVVPLSHAKRLHTYLESVLKNIEFAASQMDKIVREHQALSRINQSFNNMGMSQIYEDSSLNTQKRILDGRDIPSRKMV